MDNIEEIDKAFEELFDGSPLAKAPVPYISIENCKLAMKGSFYAGYAFCQEEFIKQLNKK